MCEKFSEFFMEDTGVLSMSRLLLFFSFLVASIIVLFDTYYQRGANEGLYAIYVGTFAGTYLGSKFADRRPSDRKQKTEAEQ